jgi:hypothetical protein
MAGRKPDIDITVAVAYTDKDGKEKTQWHNVGHGWSGDDGALSFSICTMPGVRFVALRKKESEGRRAA